jgi:hypothetical protein
MKFNSVRGGRICAVAATAPALRAHMYRPPVTSATVPVKYDDRSDA